MTLLIIGGAGYVGAELIAYMAIGDFKEIIVYDNLSRKNFNFFFGKNKLKNKLIRFVQGDILDTRKLTAEVNKASVVVHLAAKVTTPFANQNSHGFDQVNNWGTSEIVRVVENAPLVTKFIYSSSTSVYGRTQDSEAFTINSPVRPRTYYSISKLEGEKHVNRLLESNIQTYILRIGNVYGYSKCMRLDSVINKFMFESNFTNRLRIDGSGNQCRSFINIKRLVKELNHIIQDNNVPSGKYNLVENVFTINEIVDGLREVFPELEMLFVNQNIKMKSQEVNKHLFITNNEFQSLKQDLLEFKEEFSF